MRASLLGLGVLAGLSLVASSCSWSRFDDVTESTPVVLLEKPNSMKQGFGVTLATASNDGHSVLLVGGATSLSRAALFDIALDDTQGTTAVDNGYCTNGDVTCSLSSLMAGFANATGPDQSRPLCFAVGAGTAVGGVTSGLVVRCKDTTLYALGMPKAAQDLLAQNQASDHPLSADRTDDPLLLASLPEKRLAWFYPPKSTQFSELALPAGAQSDDPSFGASLAVLAVDGGRVLAVGVPGKSEVFLWKTGEGDGSTFIGCLGGTGGMGRALAAGKVNADAADDLVISDDSLVRVLDGAALFGLPETSSTECGLSFLPKGSELGSFGCASSGDVSGCDSSEFGAAVAVGDLDGDGDGEVIVGAPKMTVRGEENAGALLIYDAEAATDVNPVDAKFISSAESGDQLGRSIVTPRLGKRDIIAAGAPGNGKAALFYCSALLAPGAAGARCP